MVACDRNSQMLLVLPTPIISRACRAAPPCRCKAEILTAQDIQARGIPTDGKEGGKISLKSLSSLVSFSCTHLLETSFITEKTRCPVTVRMMGSWVSPGPKKGLCLLSTVYRMGFPSDTIL
ncbi:hypothetical protein EDD15DRAFT_915380 [Pisolithus albus]|nr:hypothetical protein EDD15DRAFT_915380 [Pisolithus albus]